MARGGSAAYEKFKTFGDSWRLKKKNNYGEKLYISPIYIQSITVSCFDSWTKLGIDTVKILCSYLVLQNQ